MASSSRLLLLRARTRMCPPRGVARGKTELRLLHRPLCPGKLRRRRLQSVVRLPLRHQDSLAMPLPLRFQARLLPLPLPNRDPERAMAASSALVVRAGTELSVIMNEMINQDVYDVMILGFSTIQVMVMFPFIHIG